MKILICGDSYMALDPGAERMHMNAMHWTSHLGVESINFAFPGASNTQILTQLQRAIIEEKFDKIVLGFTCPARLEFGPKITSCHHTRVTQEQLHLDKSYRKNIHWGSEIIRNISIIEYTILLARRTAPTVYTLNNLHRFTDIIELYPQQRLVDLEKESMPFSLIRHREFPSEPDPNSKEDYATFHVADPEVHKKFALQVRQCLDLS